MTMPPDTQHPITQQQNSPTRPSATAAPLRRAATKAQRGWRPQAAAAVFAGRATGALVRRLRMGGGTSISGLVAQRIDPTIIPYLGAQLRFGSLVVTGTNGKTTTSGMISSVLRAAGLRIWRNREGSNLVRGVTAALVIRSQLSGRLRRGGDAAAVFEVDEAAFPQVVRELQPRAVVVTNLFRDQLDRYGEVDTVAERWKAALATVPAARLVLNADDPAVAALADGSPQAEIIFYGVEDAANAGANGESSQREVIDTRTCPRCRSVLIFTQRFYSHVGHWACPNCGYARPQPTVFARSVIPDGLDGSRFTLVTPDGAQETHISLPGLYNVYNALAAAAAGVAMDAAGSSVGAALSRFTPAFGRAERIPVEGREVRLLLTKNPTGLNEVLRALTAAGEPLHLLMMLNDRAADGEDVSWIWDASFEYLTGKVATATVSGVRAYDLALRLKYAGVPDAQIAPETAPALDAALAQTPVGETLCIIPTYTALLAIRGELERRGYAPHYWEQRDV